MTQKSGCVVNVSSMAGVHGTKGGVPYSSSKAALQMFTRVTAAEWGPYGIRINCVAPGMILSEEVEEHLRRSNIDIEGANAIFPLRRAGKPEDVANAIVFLASDAASYISGETLAVCGGPVLGGPRDL
jgi:NAD(P)-dependent dehydrogenase (short-subunit alcohol dehydrogenase family)